MLIGLELGTAFAKLGARVTVIESAERLLPQYDAELSAPVLARAKELNIDVFTSATVLGRAADGNGVAIEHANERRTIESETILVTVGRRAALDGWGLNGTGSRPRRRRHSHR